jgi:hypothetical protein
MCACNAAAFGALSFQRKSGYGVVRLTEKQLSGDSMKYLNLALVLFGVASFAASPARAFDIEGERATLDGATPFAASADPDDFISQNFGKGGSLALPYIGKTDSDYIADYGNAIPIPGPGIDRPSPAWAYSPHY